VCNEPGAWCTKAGAGGIAQHFDSRHSLILHLLFIMTTWYPTMTVPMMIVFWLSQLWAVGAH